MAVRVITNKHTAFDLPEVSEGIVTFLQNKDQAKKHLYEHQIEAALQIKQHFDGPNRRERAIVVLPTGCGKTGVAVVASYALKVHRVLVITPSAAISDQIHTDFVGVDSKGKKVGTFMVNRGILDDDWKYVPSCSPTIKKPREVPSCLPNDLLIVNAHKLRKDILLEIPPNHYDLVIVDEAHHYPADTWRIPTDYFKNSKKIFLTATPYHRIEGSLENVGTICYKLEKSVAIRNGIIRDLKFDELPYIAPDESEDTILKRLSDQISMRLDEHDRMDNTVKHQAMVLVRKTAEADEFAYVYNREYGENLAETYYGGAKPYIVDNFRDYKYRVLVVAGKLTEGFDHKPVSVVAIARNVQVESQVLFSQFVGRAVRKVRSTENIDATLISHARYNQRETFELFDKIITPVEMNDELSDEEEEEEVEEEEEAEMEQ